MNRVMEGAVLQNHEDVSRLVMREINEIVYISDVKTYELLYLNRRAVELLGSPAISQWRGKPCYKVLQNRNEPCEFCTNACLNKKEFYCWEHDNEMLKRHFFVKDKLVEWDGRMVRLEIAVDNTEKENIHRQLQKNLAMEKTLVDCIRTLSKNSDLTAAINDLLGIIGNYYAGDRAYIFECDYENELLVNTYEWCRLGIEPQIDHLKQIPLHAADRWIEAFQKRGEFYISCLTEYAKSDSVEYKILEPQGVQSLIAAPLMDGEAMIGFIGVDNPLSNIGEMVLLQSVSFFVLDDIKKKKLTGQLQELSYKDTLTGVWNRNKYMEVLDQYERTTPEKLGIIYADINGLKRANDLHGHQYGDRLICRAAELLSGLFRNRVYRIGGDEFVVLCTELSHTEFYKKIDRLYDEVHRDGACSISIGLKWSEEGEDVNKQIISADRLMYADKQRYYSARNAVKCEDKEGRARKIAREIEAGRFVVCLQPKIEIGTGKLCGAEAFVRRIDRQGRTEMPIQFIPRYEAEGIIRHIDFFVLERVCQLLARWEKMGNTSLKIAVNFAHFTLTEHRAAEKIEKICRRFGIPADRIVLEVSGAIGQMGKESLKRLLQSLKQAGFTVSLDNFGAESLNYAAFLDLQFDEIKLDKCLIDRIASDERAQIVAKHVIELCRDLKVKTSVAAGIETQEQLRVLEDFRCGAGQGYLFDRPLSEEIFEKKYIMVT